MNRIYRGVFRGRLSGGQKKSALSGALLRAKRSMEVTTFAVSNALFLALGSVAGLDLWII